MSNLDPQLARDSQGDFGPSPSQEQEDRYPKDRVLREAGYEIHSRPQDGPVLWRRRSDGKVLMECVAFGIVARSKK